MPLDTKTVKLTDTLKRNEELISSDIDDETVMMSLEQGQYYGLDAIGSRIWELYATPQTLNKVIETLLVEFDVDEETCKADVINFVQQLLDNNLLMKENS